MGEKQSLIALIKHIFIDIINQKKRSFLIIYLSMLVIDRVNYMVFHFFAIGVSYFVLSVICNIVLVYFYLSMDDSIPLDAIKKAVTENFFGAFKVATVNLLILIIILLPIVGVIGSFSPVHVGYSGELGTLSVFIMIILLFIGGIFIVSITSLSIIHSIVEHTGIRVSFRNGINTTRLYFELIFKLMTIFIILAIPAASEMLIMGFLSLILQLSFISIAIDCIKRQNAK